MTAELSRLHSGIPGLDAVLGGGFVEGSSYIVQGEPGAGKTVLATQMAFAQAKNGRRVLYATLLAESHERMFQSLSTLDFFDPVTLGDGVTFVSVFQTLRGDGLEAVVSLLRKEISRQSATMLVIDGLLNARDKAGTTLDVKTFVAEIQGHAAFAGCTVLFLTSAPIAESSPEHTMVDGVVELSDEVFGVRSVRRLRVRKSRGTAAMGGYHQFTLSRAGMTLYPRIERAHAYPSADARPEPRRLSTGSKGLDAMTWGGLPHASVTLLVGPPGSGKTTLGLSYLAAAPADEPALLFGFYETPQRLMLKAEALEIPIGAGLESGGTELIWTPMTENLLDKLGHTLLEAVARRNVKRLVIDGLAGFERAAVSPPRLVEFVLAIANELRGLGVTSLWTWESGFRREPPNLATPEFLSGIDNLLTLDHLHNGPELSRLATVMKMRDSAFEPGTRSMEIGRGGLNIGGIFAGAANVQSNPAALLRPFS